MFDTDDRDEYEIRVDKLNARIDRLVRDRDAAEEDSFRREKFQGQINELLDEKEAWEDHAPKLRKLDSEIVNAERKLSRIQYEAGAQRSLWPRVTGFCGAFGMVSLLFGLGFDLVAWFHLVGIALLGVAVYGFFAGAKTRNEGAGRVADARETLRVLTEGRTALAGSIESASRPASSSTAGAPVSDEVPAMFPALAPADPPVMSVESTRVY